MFVHQMLNFNCNSIIYQELLNTLNERKKERVSEWSLHVLSGGVTIFMALQSFVARKLIRGESVFMSKRSVKVNKRSKGALGSVTDANRSSHQRRGLDFFSLQTIFHYVIFSLLFYNRHTAWAKRCITTWRRMLSNSPPPRENEIVTTICPWTRS